MKLTALTIAGFKGIKEKATIPLAPITLFFGANSTGKSTVLHALLYLFEVISHRNLDAQHSSIAGEALYFGGFLNLVHGKNQSGKITLGATLDFSEANSAIWHDYLSDVESDLLQESLGFTPDSTADDFSFEIDIEWDTYNARPFISRYECFSASVPYIRFDTQAGSKGAFITHYSPPPDWNVDDSFKIKNLFKSDQWEAVSIKAQDALPALDKRFDLSNISFSWQDIFEDNSAMAKLFAEATLSQCSLAPLVLLVKKLQSLQHIGPVRVIPNQTFIANKTDTTQRWYDGSGAWDRFTASDDALRNKVNGYFSDETCFNTGYKFQTENLGQAPHDEKRVLIWDENGNYPLLPIQVGVGISQVFPFIVAALDNKYQIVSCEQPELHIHPRWQLLLGDMMLEACHQHSEKLFLIETHSEHLMLRLLKRRRETAEGELNQVDLLYTKKHDIQIIFCEQEFGETRLFPMKTTDEGEFDAPWPNGFFMERREELF